MKHRWLVRDEEGRPLRMFWSRAEAEAFLLPGYTVEKQDAPAKPSIAEMLADIEDARF